MLKRVLIACSVAVLTAACGVLFSGGACTDEFMPLVRLTPPADSRVISESCATGFNPTHNIAFTIRPDQVAEVQASVAINEWNSAEPTDRFGELAARADTYSYGIYSDGAVYLEMLIDTSSATRYVVHYSGAFVD